MEQLEILKKIEIQKLISLKWKFLNNTYPYIDYKRYHRTELKEINLLLYHDKMLSISHKIIDNQHFI